MWTHLCSRLAYTLLQAVCEMMLCEDELQHLMRDCEPSFVITDSDHIDSVQFASATQSEATNLKVCSSKSFTYSHIITVRCVGYSTRRGYGSLMWDFLMLRLLVKAENLLQFKLWSEYKSYITVALDVLRWLLRYDTKEEFNMDSKAECDQLNLAHVVRN